MSTTPSAELLSGESQRVLEESAFMILEPAPWPSSWPDAVVSASITIDGPWPGELRLLTTREVATSAAAGMLAVEPDDDEAQEGALAAVGELANMLAGSIVARVFGTRVTCPLGIPVVDEGGAPPRRDGVIAASFRDDEGRPVAIELRVLDAPPRGTP